MLNYWNGLLWLVVFIGPQLVLQRSLHLQIQIIFLLITRRVEIAYTMFSLVFFPGVLLHESSHYVMARLLGVQTGRVSLLPKPVGDGKLQLGYVETVPSDWLRDALIGAAPLITGGLFVAYAGLARLGLMDLWTAYQVSGWEALHSVIPAVIDQPDFWLWFYLALAVSSTMLPSPSDRRTWLPIGLVIAVLLAVSLLFGAGPWMAENLAPVMNQVLLAVAIVFAISVFIHLMLLPPLWAIRYLLSWLMRVEVR